MTTIVLTARDMDLLAFLALHRECPLEHLAARFFAINANTGAANTRAEKECARRINKLKQHGYLDTLVVPDGRKRRVAVRVAARAEPALDDRAARRSVPPRERLHHLKTLDAIAHIEAEMQKRGGRVVEFRVEAAIRAEALRGRRTRRGDTFDAFPDAVCTIALPTAAGERIEHIAVEYVTNKYCDNDIRLKHESFAGTYDGALWFADKGRTASRVERVTGEKCSLLT